jgi:hypothetical protein
VIGNVADIAAGATSGTHSAALSAGADSQGDVLSQRFFTTANSIYMLDFDAVIAGNPANGANLQIEVQVIGNSLDLDHIITPPVPGSATPSSNQFQHYHFVFTADSDTTTLKFSNIGLGNANADEVIDTVSVVPAPAPTPTPTPTPIPPTITSVQRLSNGDILLQGAGGANQTYMVKVSPNLTSTPQPTATVSADANGNFQYEDVNSGTLTEGFYWVLPP